MKKNTTGRMDAKRKGHTGKMSHATSYHASKHDKTAHHTHHAHNKAHGGGGFHTGEHYESGPMNPEGNEKHC